MRYSVFLVPKNGGGKLLGAVLTHTHTPVTPGARSQNGKKVLMAHDFGRFAWSSKTHHHYTKSSMFLVDFFVQQLRKLDKNDLIYAVTTRYKQ